MSLFKLKDINSVKETSSNGQLDRTLGPWDLLALGIGAVIGTGIFVLTGIASQDSGPALFISFLISGIACMFVALVYTEVAAMIPTSGSVYTYAYASLGELAAWITSWILILEFSGGPMAVAAGWSGYIVEIFRQGGIHIPHYLTAVPSHGGIVNLPAIFISLFITFLLVRGTQTGTLVNNVLVIVKLGAIFLFLVVAAPHFKLSNWENFTPFGAEGVFKAAALMILAYTGFDSVATAVEECKNPKRDVIIGLIGSLVLSTILYMAVSAMLTGIVPFTELNNAKPLAQALTLNGSHIGSALVAVGGVAGMTTVILVQIYAQSRVLFVMARDGLLPKAFCKLHPKYHTPYIPTIIVGVMVALVSGFVPIAILGNLASMGTLAVFMIAAVTVIVLRKKLPNADRPFKCPAVYLVSALAILSCGFLFMQLIKPVGIYFLAWLLIGIAVYFLYSYKASRTHEKINVA